MTVRLQSCEVYSKAHHRVMELMAGTSQGRFEWIVRNLDRHAFMVSEKSE